MKNAIKLSNSLKPNVSLSNKQITLNNIKGKKSANEKTSNKTVGIKDKPIRIKKSPSSNIVTDLLKHDSSTQDINKKESPITLTAGILSDSYARSSEDLLKTNPSNPWDTEKFKKLYLSDNNLLDSDDDKSIQFKVAARFRPFNMLENVK
jgi:hypothetical protein